MKNWNPYVYPFCRNCPLYRPEGTYIFELEENPKLRQCRFKAQCSRIAELLLDGEQMKLGGI